MPPEIPMEHRVDEAARFAPGRDTPVPRGYADGNLEARADSAREPLGSVWPRAAVSLAWRQARCGKDVPLRSHPTPGLLVILAGDAMLSGAVAQKVRAGDVISLPRDSAYGFTAVGRAGLHALHLAFDGAAAGSSNEASSLQQLLARNEVRLQTALNGSFFMLLRRRGVDSRGNRVDTRANLQSVADALRTIQLTRQALCRGEDYVAQLNGAELAGGLGSSLVATDLALSAMSSWFCRQMLDTEHAGKLVMNLVLQTGGSYMAALATPMFEDEPTRRRLEAYAAGVNDDSNAAQLEGLHAQAYTPLCRLLNASWDLVDAMTQRFAQLIEPDVGSQPAWPE